MRSDPHSGGKSTGELGFTMIEVLMAMAIFAIGILAVASLQLWTVKNNTTGNITTQAAMLARTKIEELKSQPIGLLVTNSYHENDDPNDRINEDGDAGGIFHRSWDVVDGPSSSSRQITVTVNWNRRGQNRSVVLSAITKGNGL